MYNVVKLGLAQIPTHGLLRLIGHIDAGKPVLLDGAVIRYDTGFM